MKHALIILSLLPACAFGQAASPAETDAVLQIAECIAQGAPPDWQRLTMVVELSEPLADTGQVRYLATRQSNPDQPVAYTPCDPRRPARVLIDSRDVQAPERKGWIGARLVLHNDGKFELNYDYPK
jgi:hypothetical protein